mgnify:CR=1 FL=1
MVVGKILLRKLMALTKGVILVVGVGKNHQRGERVAVDPYFTEEEQGKIRKQVKFMHVAELKKEIEGTRSQKIDLLFSLTEPIDFSNSDKFINNHLILTGDIIKEMTGITIDRCLLLSSIYLKEAGYVG